MTDTNDSTVARYIGGACWGTGKPTHRRTVAEVIAELRAMKPAEFADVEAQLAKRLEHVCRCVPPCGR